MNTSLPSQTSTPRTSRRRALFAALAAVVVAGIALDTTVVRVGSEQDVRANVFNPESFGAAEFPGIRASVEDRATDAATLAAAIAADKAAATEAHSVGGVFPVSFTGVAGEGKSGIYPITVAGMPETVLIRLQTGPAINGTDLRDATGTILFGQFKNQIEYQDAGSALNNVVKAEVLAPIDTKALTGKTVTVTGVFKLVNPKSWLVTPVRMDVQ
jgi:predicted lipoprotein